MFEVLFEQKVPKLGHKTCNQSMFSSLLLMTKYSFYDSDQSHFDKAFIISAGFHKKAFLNVCCYCTVL